jgi:hypothetical protein
VQQWAFDNGKTGAVVVTWTDIAPYTRHLASPDGRLKSVAGERYVFKGLHNPPEAQLMHRLEQWPKGSVVRFSTNGDWEVLPPK